MNKRVNFIIIFKLEQLSFWNEISWNSYITRNPSTDLNTSSRLHNHKTYTTKSTQPYLFASIERIKEGTLYLLLNTGQLRVENSDGVNMLLHFLFFLPKLTVEVSSFFAQSCLLLLQFGNLLASAFCFFFCSLQLLKKAHNSKLYHRSEALNDTKVCIILVQMLYHQTFFWDP